VEHNEAAETRGALTLALMQDYVPIVKGTVLYSTKATLDQREL